MEILENNSQSISDKPERAEWWRRLVGLLIDALPIFILAMEIEEYRRESGMKLVYFVMFYIPWCIIWEGLFYRTLGKIVTGTTVINSGSLGRPSFGQILGRSFSKLIPFDGLSFISKKPRGWHDSIPNTTVIKIKNRRMIKRESFKVDFYSSNLLPKRIIILKTLNKGIYRLIIALSFFAPLIIAILVVSFALNSDAITFVVAFFLGLVIYWILIFVGLWIYEGFEEGK